MITVSFEFFAGQFHATPWGRHVNEGAVEWPPSPWRILRALIATWKRTLPELTQEQVEPVLLALAQPPEFALPPASTGHTRHYMPAPEKKTKVFDTFVAVQPEAKLLACWPGTTLEDSQKDVLASILKNLNVLGRSESWCSAEITEDNIGSDAQICRPFDGNVQPDYELIRLLCPDPANAFNDDYVTTIRESTTGRGKTRVTETEKLSLYDPAWNVCMETLQLHQERWSDPPGSRWITYTRPRDCFKIEYGAKMRQIKYPPVHVARFALDSTVLPLITETLPVAEAARRALMALYGRITEKEGEKGRSAVLSGKNNEGEMLTGHRHAFYIPTDEDNDGHLDHLTVFAPAGFHYDEQLAFDRLHVLRTGRQTETRYPLRTLLLGWGASNDYRAGPLNESNIWISVTPYIATRYAKTKGRKRIDIGSPEDRFYFLREDLQNQLADVRPDLLDSITHIEPLWDDNQVFLTDGKLRPLQFKRYRRRAGDDGSSRLAGTFKLIFSSPVSGPLALGWSNHFGMGLFMPVCSDGR